MRKLRVFLFLSALMFAANSFMSTSAHAAVQIPKNLTSADRDQALRIIGLGMSEKLLSDPYPLGGYDGFEVGLSFESLPTDSLARLGSKLATPQEEITYPKLTVGKGIYNNLDIFVQFTPYRRADELTQFGGMVRWGFYQGQLFPFSASLLLHANSANASNLLASRTYGADLMSGISVSQISVFAGVGILQSSGTFTGGAGGVNAPEGGQPVAQMQTQTVSSLHTFVGGNLRFFRVAFLAVQLDRTEVPVISGKLGFRF